MSVPFVPSPFRPARWLPGAHLQTLGARFLRRWSGVPFVRERVELDDGDFVDLDYAFGPEPADEPDRPLVLLLHGLEGSARSRYALEVYRALARHDISSVGLNFRSCSGELNRLPRLYHSGDTGDLERILTLLMERFPDRPRGAVGFSLGGNVLMKFLGEKGPAAGEFLQAAVAISVPYDLGAGADHLRRLGGRVYSSFLLRKLRRKVSAKRHIMPVAVDLARVAAAATFRDFDNAATAPLHGFADADDYYQQSSSGPLIDAIRIPTLIIQAEDDPFLPSECIPLEAAVRNPVVVPVVTRTGGHAGFVARGFPWRPVFWAESEAARYLAAALGASSVRRGASRT